MGTALALGLACGGATESPAGAPPLPGESMFEGPFFFEQDDGAPSPGVNPEANPDGVDGLVDGQPPPGSASIPVACVIDEENAEIVALPVDIILLLDNSGSMSDELEAVEANINVNFAAILASSNVDYRMILISRHRQDPREDTEEASTSICVSSPLSSLSDCAQADEPVFSDRFFQYSTKLESSDSFDVLLDTYAPPFASSEREEKFDHAPLGWSDWLRPSAKKVFLEMTDDDEDMAPADFVEALVGMAPEHFGRDAASPTFVFHSIIGLAEKPEAASAVYLPSEPLQLETCTGNDNVVESAGESYQELSRISGGLRFPLCQFDAYDVVFKRIAEDVVQTRIACDFPIPPPPRGLELDLNNVAIEYAPGNAAAPTKFGQAPSLTDCQSNAFYIDNERLTLCPATCSAVRSDPRANVKVLFTCESQLIVPR